MASKNTIIIGLGNPILSDDGVGIHAARRLNNIQEVREVAEVVEVYAGGLRLLDVLADFKRAIIIDAMQTGAPPGTVRKFSIADLPRTRNLASTHDVDLPTAIEAGRSLGMNLPREIDVFGIEAEDVVSFGERLTPMVAQGLEEAIRLVREII